MSWAPPAKALGRRAEGVVGESYLADATLVVMDLEVGKDLIPAV